MKTLDIRYWKLVERHPLSAEYEDWDEETRKRAVADLKEHGNINDRKIVVHEDKVLDGWQFYQCCIEADIRPEFKQLPKTMDPNKYVQIANDNRRHESQAMIERHLRQRMERVAAAREAGESFRTIAEKEGISPATAKADADKAGVQDRTPETVTGKDGKAHPAKKPKKDDGAQEKTGKPKFDDSKIKAAYETFVKLIDQRCEKMGKGTLPESAKTHQQTERDEKSFAKAAGFNSRHRRIQELMGAVLDEYQLWKKDQ